MISIFFHIPVLSKEVITFLNPQQNKIYVDGTLGGGGHTRLIAEATQGKAKIIGIDQDVDAIAAARNSLQQYCNIIIIHNNFRNISAVLDQLNIQSVDGILLDLGVSTYQLENYDRGFSFDENNSNNSVLDMRMNQQQKLTAEDVVNKYTLKELLQVFGKNNVIAFAENVARKIIQARAIKPIRTTNELRDVVKSAIPAKFRFSRSGHYASPFFRALRAEVNDEIHALREVIPQAIEKLNPGGRLVIITFDSFEDSIFKHTFRRLAQTGKVRLLTNKPIVATNEEIAENPKSSSAKLRAVEKV